MTIDRGKKKSSQAMVSFSLKVWDYDRSKSFQMITRSASTEFNHNIGVVSVESEDLEIKKNKTEDYSDKFLIAAKGIYNFLQVY